MQPIDAWLNTTSGTIIPCTHGNREFGKKPTVIKIKAIPNAENTYYVNATGDTNINQVMNSKSIERIVVTLQSIDAQRAQLVASALLLPGGETALKQLGLYDSKKDGQVAIQPAAPVKEDPELEAMKKTSQRKVPAKKTEEIDL